MIRPNEILLLICCLLILIFISKDNYKDKFFKRKKRWIK